VALAAGRRRSAVSQGSHHFAYGIRLAPDGRRL